MSELAEQINQISEACAPPEAPVDPRGLTAGRISKLIPKDPQDLSAIWIVPVGPDLVWVKRARERPHQWIAVHQLRVSSADLSAAENKRRQRSLEEWSNRAGVFDLKFQTRRELVEALRQLWRGRPSDEDLVDCFGHLASVS